MTIKHMDIKEFREFGYLQEVNRLLLHPLGLALEISIGDDGVEYLSGIWDYRDDPEGIVYADGVIDVNKADNVDSELANRIGARLKIFGWYIQPIVKGES